MYCAVVEHGALLRLQQVQREQLALSAEGQNQRTPGRQLLLPRVNIGLQSEENSRETSDRRVLSAQLSPAAAPALGVTTKYTATSY